MTRAAAAGVAVTAAAVVFAAFVGARDDAGVFPGGVLGAAATQKRDLLPNGRFETSLAGWSSPGRIVRARGGVAGPAAARALASPGRTALLSAQTRNPPARGAAYSAEAWVRGASETQVCLRIEERSDGKERCAGVGRQWRRLVVTRYTARGGDGALRVVVRAVTRGVSLDVDGVALRQLSASSPAVSALSAQGLDHSHVRLTWPPVAGAVDYRVLRDGLLVARLAEPEFTDALLWPQTRYEYTIEAVSAAGAVMWRGSASAATTPLPPGGFPSPFPRDSVWNRPVGPSPRIHPRNRELIEYFVAKGRNPNMTLRAWGVSVAEARPGDPEALVPCTAGWACALGALGTVPLPLTARPDPEDDGHLVVHDPVGAREWGMWQARREGNTWKASAGAAVSLRGDGIAPARTGAANAANFPLLGGLVRPEEILQGRIEHALVFGLPGIGRGRPVCPASHNAATTSDPNALREGQRVQLDPAVDVDALPIARWQKPIARAMQEYGMYLRDNSGTLSVYAETPASRGYDAWALLGLTGSSAPLKGIPWNRFRVIDAPDC